MRRRVGRSKPSNSYSSKTDTTRTKRICLGFLAVAILTIFYVNFLNKLDQLGTEVEEASKKGTATVTVQEDVKNPQLSFTVYDQQKTTERNNDVSYSTVDPNAGSADEVTEEGEEETPEGTESADEEKQEQDDLEESVDEEVVENDESSKESFDGENGAEDEDNVADESVDDQEVDEVGVEVQQNITAAALDKESESVSSAILSTNVTTIDGGANDTHNAETSAIQCKVRFKNNDMKICHFIPYDGNFGDELGPAAILKTLENEFYPCSVEDIPVLNLRNKRQPEDVCLFNLGSIFHFIQTDDHVWGTGINPYWQKKYPQNLTIYGVRGPKTEALIRKNCDVLGSIGHGDPGFLIPSLFPQYQKVTPKKQKQGEKPRICFVPHFQDKDYAELKLLPSEDVIAVKNKWQPVVEAIHNCDYVASSSLHGIIIAIAIGIPTMWFQFPEGETSKTEGSFKYLDFFESIGLPDKTPVGNFSLVFDYEAYDPIIPESQRKSIFDGILSTFPYHLFETDKDLKENKSFENPINGTETSVEESESLKLDINSSTIIQEESERE